MNLLERSKQIVENDEGRYYEKIKYMALAVFAPKICKALLEAMDEIEKRQLENNNWDEQNGMLKALEILHNHLGAGK